MIRPGQSSAEGIERRFDQMTVLELQDKITGC